MSHPASSNNGSSAKLINDTLGVQKLLDGGCSDKLILQLTGISADELLRIKNLLE